MVSNIPNVGNYQYQQQLQTQTNVPAQAQTIVNQNSTNPADIATAAQAALKETNTNSVQTQTPQATTNQAQATSLTPELNAQAEQVATQAASIPTFNNSYPTANLPFENSLDINNSVFMQNPVQYPIAPQNVYPQTFANNGQNPIIQQSNQPLALDTNDSYFNAPPKNNTSKKNKCAADKSDNAAIIATIGLGVIALLSIIFDPAKRNPQSTIQTIQNNYNNAIPDFFSNLGTKIKNWWNPSRSKKVVQNNGQGFFSKIGSKFKNGWQATTNKTKNKFQKLKEKLSLEKVTENLINTICKKPKKKINVSGNVANQAQRAASINPNDYKIVFNSNGYERHYNDGKVEIYDAIGNLIKTILK